MHYFVSDCHFRTGSGDDARISLLLKFFDTIKTGCQGVYLLGDLFEFGFEYRRAIPKSQIRVLSALDRLVRSRVPVYYLKGNHDLWLGNFLKSDLGISVFDSPVVLTLDGKRAWLGHGDEVDTSRAHRLSRIIFRNRFNIFCFSLLHPDLGIRLAESIALLNRKRCQSQGLALADFARHKIGSEDFDLVILGHSHTPTVEPVGTGYYVNTGDWITNYSYAVLENGLPRIERFSL